MAFHIPVHIKVNFFSIARRMQRSVSLRSFPENLYRQNVYESHQPQHQQHQQQQQQHLNGHNAHMYGHVPRL